MLEQNLKACIGIENLLTDAILPIILGLGQSVSQPAAIPVFSLQR